jgi:hypothetical protein
MPSIYQNSEPFPLWVSAGDMNRTLYCRPTLQLPFIHVLLAVVVSSLVLPQDSVLDVSVLT